MTREELEQRAKNLDEALEIAVDALRRIEDVCVGHPHLIARDALDRIMAVTIDREEATHG
jgi:hypothetical protein